MRLAQTGYLSSAGQGVAPIVEKPLPQSILQRIERLGKMNDRRIRHINMRSRRGLFRLAADYRRLGMPIMAAEIYEEARAI